MPRRQKTVEERLAEIVREIGPERTKQILAMLIALFPPRPRLETTYEQHQEPPGSEPQRKEVAPE